MQIPEIRRILVVGASGDLGLAVLNALAGHNVLVGAHCHRHRNRLDLFLKSRHRARIRVLTSDISSQAQSKKLVQSFIRWAGGIDGLVQLSGSIKKPKNWEILDQKTWDRDIAVNLSGPFFLAQEAMKHMKKHGGRIILTSTASAAHGGGKDSMAYGAAKAGIECLAKGLAREGARHGILVNALAPGFIMTKFHREQMKRNKKDLLARAKMVPLKRAGLPQDIASMVLYLLSPSAGYITGQVITISGGDWL